MTADHLCGFVCPLRTEKVQLCCCGSRFGQDRPLLASWVCRRQSFLTQRVRCCSCRHDMSFLLHVRIVSQLRPQTRATAQRKHPQACETNQPLSFPPVWPPKALPPETDITSFNHIVAYTRSSLVESDPETFQLQTQCPIDQLS